MTDVSLLEAIPGPREVSSPRSSLNRAAVLWRDLRRYLNYFFQRRGFTTAMQPPLVSDLVIRAAKTIRGRDRPPAIMVHGIMPRSGTVYLGQLLRLHPEIHAYPHQLWELPALMQSPRVMGLAKGFLLEYKPNLGRMAEGDFLPLFGASLLAYLYEDSPPSSRLLVKSPSVQYITHFYSMFPHEYLVLLVRDGRDVVHSTLRTWPKLTFLQACLRWRRSADAVLSAKDAFQGSREDQYFFARFEEAISDPSKFVRALCRHSGLDADRFPFDQIDSIKVIGSSKLTIPGETVEWRWLPKPKGFQPTGHWQKWPSTRKLMFKAVAGRQLMDLGYGDNLDW